MLSETMIRFAALQACPVFSKPAVDGGVHRGVQVVGAQHDERVGAAELEDDLLQVAARDLGDGGARALGAGQRNALHAWVGDDVRDLLVGRVDVDVGALGIPGVVEDLLHGRRRLGALRSVLEQDGVAQRQVRSREPGDLVVRVVPRHDAEQHADRAAPNERRALAVEKVDGLVGEELLGVVGVVLVDRPAELGLALGLVDRLAHLAVDDLRELFLALIVQLADLADQLGAVGDRRPSRPFAVGLAGRRDRVLRSADRSRSGTP